MLAKFRIDPMADGLKVFFDLKYQSTPLEYSSLPTLLNNITYLTTFVEQIADQDEFLLDASDYFELNDLLEQYFRNDFLHCVDRKSIESYLASRGSIDFEFLLYFEIAQYQNKESDYYSWLQKTIERIKVAKLYERHGLEITTGIIKNISFDEFKNEEIKSFLSKYFLTELECVFAHIHLYVEHGVLRLRSIRAKVESKNNLLSSKIDDFFEKFNDLFSPVDKTTLKQALVQYFSQGAFPNNVGMIKIQGRFNKKRIGWALFEIYRSQTNERLAPEYLRFAKDHISIFAKDDFDETTFTKSNLYKFFTTRTP